MQQRDLPRRPGEHVPGDVGKKGGSTEKPIVDEPTDVPGGPSSEEGDTLVDISTTIDRKLEALGRHESQLVEFGDWQDMVRRLAKERGAPAGMEFAESFRTFVLNAEDESDD